MSEFSVKIKRIIATICGNLCVGARDSQAHNPVGDMNIFTPLKVKISRNWNVFSKSLDLQITLEQVLLTSIAILSQSHEVSPRVELPGLDVSMSHYAGIWSSCFETSKLV